MSAGADALARLLTVLEAEERLYVELRELLQRERELIASFDAVALEQCVRRKETLSEEGRLLEESRLPVAAELGRELGLPQERPTLTQLCDALGERGDALREAHSRLAALVGAVQELLAAGAVFAGEAQGRVQATLQLLGRLLPEVPLYQPSGAGEPVAPSGRLVRQSA